MGRVLVLGDGARAFLAVVRSLGRRGHEVDCAWHEPDGPEQRCRYLRRRLAVAPDCASDTGGAHELTVALRGGGYDLVIPCTDAALAALMERRELLAPHARLAVPGDRAYALLVDKARAAECAEAAGVPVAPRRRIASLDELDAAAHEWGFPLVLKPRQSHNAADPAQKHSVRIVHSTAEMRRSFPALEASGGVTAEKYFAGHGVGVELLLQDGEPLLTFQHERVHEPLSGGGSSYRRSVAIQPALRDAALAILGPLNYTGVAMVEFKADPASGKWIFIEVNPRFWGSLPLACACGVDFPAALYDLLIEGRRPQAAYYPIHRYARNLTADLGWMRANCVADRSQPAALTARRWRPLWEWAAHTLQGRERLDTWAWDDPYPLLAELAGLARRAARALRQTARDAFWRLAPSEWARARLAGRLTRARTVVAVCRGNVCRSPYAAAWLAAHCPAVEVRSAGLRVRTARPAPPEALAAARPLGVDLSTHRSRLLSQADVDAADALLAFDPWVESELLARYRGVRGKLVPLWRLDGGRPIADPWGESEMVFAATYQRITGLLSMALATAAADTAPAAGVRPLANS